MAEIVTPNHRRKDLHAGEGETLRVLEEGLPDRWLIANNFIVSGREADVVVVSPARVYLIEVKNHGGYLRVTEQGMTRNGEPLGNPIYQVTGVAKVLRSYLDKDSATGTNRLASGTGPDRGVYELVAFSNPRARIIQRDDDVMKRTVHLNELVDRLIDLDDGQSQRLTEDERRRIANKLAGLEGRPDVPARILEYKVEEVLDRTDGARLYAARHEDGTRYHLRVLRPPRTEDEQRAELEERALLREYDALRDLAPIGVCPEVMSYRRTEDGDIVVPLVATEGRTLQDDIDRGQLPDEDELQNVVAAAFESLSVLHAHESRPVHRALTPERVLLREDGTVTFTGFHVARLDSQTMMPTLLGQLSSVADDKSVFRHESLNISLSAATVRTDVYALASCLWAWATGSEKAKNFKRLTLSGEREATLGSVAQQFLDLVERCRDSSAPAAAEVAAEWGRDPARSASTDPSRTQIREATETPLIDRDDPVGDLVDGRYRILKKLGKGGSATTFLAEDEQTQMQWVLKSFDFDAVDVDSALREFNIASKLTHDRIAAVRGYYRVGHPYNLRIDFVPGRTLDLLANEFVDDWERLGELACAVLEGLSYLHGKDYVHGDVSWTNVICRQDAPDEAKLIDFGLSGLRGSGTQPGGGTMMFLAPEVKRGEHPDFPSDVYGAGVILFRLLTGVMPFRMAPAPVHEELIDPPTELSKRSRELATLLLSALQVRPEDRFPDAGEFLSAVQDFLTAPDQPATVEAGEAKGGWLASVSSFVRERPTTEAASTTDNAAPVEPASRRSYEPLMVADVPSTPKRHDGNCWLGIGRSRKYSLLMDGTIRGVLPLSLGERSLIAEAPPELVEAVNAAKAAGGQSPGGSFVIDPAGNVLTGTHKGVLAACRVSGYPSFDGGDTVLTPLPPEGLEPGSEWPGLRVGVRYKLNAATDDIGYERPTGGFAWLSESVGEQRARDIAGGFGRVKPGGGVLYVNEAGAVFGPVQRGGTWLDAFVGTVPDDWFG